jgi:hypothetical protein
MDVETIVQALEAHKRGEKRDQTMVRFLAYRGYVTVTPVTHMQAPGPEYLIIGITEKGRELMNRHKK